MGDPEPTLRDDVLEAAAEVVIGAVLAQPDPYLVWVRDTCPDGTLWPPSLAGAYESLLRRSVEGELVVEGIAHESGVPVDLLYNCMLAGREVTDDRLQQVLAILVDRGQRQAEKRVGQALLSGSLTGPQAVERLERVRQRGLVEPDTGASALADDLLESLQGDPEGILATGVPMLDFWTWRWMAHQMTLLLARYGGRKSSVMRNLVLGAASRGHAVGVALLEGTAREFTADCVAMIANALLLPNGRLQAITKSDSLPAFSGEMILTTRKWRNHPDRWSAFQRATALYRALPLTVFDKRHGILHPPTLESKFMRLYYDGKMQFGVLDYVQKMQYPGTIYERMVQAQDFISRLTSKPLHLLVLSQKSEEANKGKTGESVGAKGGGDLPAEAQNVISVIYDDPDEDVLLHDIRLRLDKGRGTRAGQGTTFQIEIASGLLTMDWREKIDVLDPPWLTGGEQGTLALP